jgi:hypothetical protein
MVAAFHNNIPKLMSCFTPYLSFYHDQGGPTSYAQTQQGFTPVSKESPDMHRALVPG